MGGEKWWFLLFQTMISRFEIVSFHSNLLPAILPVPFRSTECWIHPPLEPADCYRTYSNRRNAPPPVCVHVYRNVPSSRTRSDGDVVVVVVGAQPHHNKESLAWW